MSRLVVLSLLGLLVAVIVAQAVIYRSSTHQRDMQIASTASKARRFESYCRVQRLNLESADKALSGSVQDQQAGMRIFEQVFIDQIGVRDLIACLDEDFYEHKMDDNRASTCLADKNIKCMRDMAAEAANLLMKLEPDPKSAAHSDLFKSGS